MKCPQCKLPTKSNQSYCGNCGIKCEQPKAVTNDKIAKKAQKELKGISGWLYLVAINLLVSLLITFTTLLAVLDAYNYATSDAIVSILTMEIFFNIVLLILLGMAIYSFTKTKKNFPHIFSAYLIISLIFLKIDDSAANTIFSFTAEENYEFYTEMVKSALAAAIWIPYMYLSRRVKSTFIN